MKHFDNDRPKFAPYGFSCEIWEPCEMARPDQHDEIELNYLPKGSLTYLMGGRRVSVPPRRLVAFWATVPHQIIDHDGESPYYVATIPFSWFLKWGMPSRLHMKIVQWEMVVDAPDDEPNREQLMFEQWIKDVGDPDLAPAAALEIQARLLRMANRISDEDEGASLENSTKLPVQLESQDKAEQMACHISRNYRDRLSIPKIAGGVDLHPDYATTLFKKTFGMTIVTFITRHRIAHAQRLLLTTDDQIIKIAADSGFDSLSRFNRAFKQVTELTPREYRRDRR